MGEKKLVKYLDIDVYTAAKQRIKHIIDTFDRVCVCFSGGKDSLATLKLVEEVYEELKINRKITVIFRDEELIPDDVINFVQSYYHTGKYDFLYYAVPLLSHKFVLGKTITYVQWETGRQWIRPKPEFAITEDSGKIYSQYDMDKFVAKDMKGKVAFLTGIRAEESLVRFRACINKKNENYINATEIANVKLCKPIYDWSENDVFKYFYEKQIRYCTIYDLQVWNSQSLRVSTPLHAESAKQFHKIRTLYPVFYQQLVEMFPEMLTHERYWKQLDRYAVIEQYPHSFDGIIQFIEGTFEDDHQIELAVQRVKMARTIRENNLSKGIGTHNYGGYPIYYVFKAIINGQYKRVIQPCRDPSKADIQYEKGGAK